jgi:hypothetical protein
MLLDSIDNDIDNKYVGLPMRQFLVDADGKIAYAIAQVIYGAGRMASTLSRTCIGCTRASRHLG